MPTVLYPRRDEPHRYRPAREYRPRTTTEIGTLTVDDVLHPAPCECGLRYAAPIHHQR